MTTTTIGGGLLALSGLLLLLLEVARGDGLLLLAALALAAGACVLAFGVRGDDVVAGSRVGRIALIVFGVGPLLFGVVFAFPLAGAAALIVGMTQLWLVTVATVLAAVWVVRARVLHGVARWALLLVAADALLTALMSTAAPVGAQLAYLDLGLEHLRPLALLATGIALLLHGQGGTIRRRVGRANATWRRTTEVGAGTLGREPEDAR